MQINSLHYQDNCVGKSFLHRAFLLSRMHLTDVKTTLHSFLGVEQYLICSFFVSFPNTVRGRTTGVTGGTVEIGATSNAKKVTRKLRITHFNGLIINLCSMQSIVTMQKMPVSFKELPYVLQGHFCLRSFLWHL